MSAALLDAALRGTALLALAGVLALLLRRASASARHLLWALTVAGLLALPVLGLVLPRWPLPVASPWAERTERQVTAAKPGRGADVPRAPGLLVPHARLVLLEAPAPPPPFAELVASRGHELPGEVRADEPQAPPGQAGDTAAPAPDDRGIWLLVLWAAGVAVSLAWVAAGFVSLRRLGRGCRAAGAGGAAELLRELADELGLRRRVRLVLSERRAVPMTWGLLRPVVLLPDEAGDWPAERLRLVLLHELGHVRRWDCLTQLLGHLARALYWFHPLAWLAVARLKAEQELACDDLVLRTGADAADYAEHLLAVTANLPEDFFAPPAALAMGRAARLRRRLATLLEPARDRRPVRRRGLALAGLLTLALVLPLAACGWRATPAAADEDAARQGEKKAPEQSPDPRRTFDEVRAKLLKHYVKPLEDKQLTLDAVRGMLKQLGDPYTEYLAPDELAKAQAQLKAVLTGIGAQLGTANGRLVVASPLEGSPALKAGVRPGDEIEAIDGKPATGLSMQAVIKRIVGPAGTVVRLKVVHADGVAEELKITRAQLRFATAEGFLRGAGGRWQFLLSAPHKVGYVRITQFGHGTAGEVRAAAEGLKKEGLKGLILDLRSCPGGLLSEAVGVCRLLLDKGPILMTSGPGKEEHKFASDGKDYLGDFPLVVLLNGQTASAGEIVAGALRDRGRAVLVGTRSFGKGSVSALLKLDAGGALKLTTSYYFLPSGRNLHKGPGQKTWGVDPTEGDYLALTAEQTEALHKAAARRRLVGLQPGEGPKWTVPVTPAVLEKEHADPQLAAALRLLVARLTGGEFIKVGRPGALPQDEISLEELRGRREELLRDLRRLEKDIEDLQKGGTRPKVPPR
jgi:carboxyl-terminal processing protease